MENHGQNCQLSEPQQGCPTPLPQSLGKLRPQGRGWTQGLTLRQNRGLLFAGHPVTRKAQATPPPGHIDLSLLASRDVSSIIGWHCPWSQTHWESWPGLLGGYWAGR